MTVKNIKALKVIQKQSTVHGENEIEWGQK